MREEMFGAIEESPLTNIGILLPAEREQIEVGHHHESEYIDQSHPNLSQTPPTVSLSLQYFIPSRDPLSEMVPRDK